MGPRIDLAAAFLYQLQIVIYQQKEFSHRNYGHFPYKRVPIMVPVLLFDKSIFS